MDPVAGDGVRTAEDGRQTGPARGEPRWEAYYALVWAIGAVIVQAAPLGGQQRITAAAGLAAMPVWYLWALRPLVREPGPDRIRRRRGCLTVLLVLFTVVQVVNPAAWFLAFALIPLCFRTVPGVRDAMVFVVLLNAVAVAVVAVRDPGTDGLPAALGIALFAAASAFVVRRWVLRVAALSEERAALIEQLEDTRAELAAAHHEAGVLAERQRLAGEIHDTLAQGFTSIVTLVQAALAGIGPDAPARQHLDLALGTARENLAEARALVTTLGPAALDRTGLAEALRRAADSAGAAGGMRARTEIAGEPRRLPTSAEVVLLRVCQESLANVRKHAAAGQDEVRLHYREAGVELTVADDGCGFEESDAGAGYGLRGMPERVRQVGGTFSVRSAPGQGTLVRAEVPA
jgi:signal transduction histidine kinase